jgi:hypothetical protein
MICLRQYVLNLVGGPSRWDMTGVLHLCNSSCWLLDRSDHSRGDGVRQDQALWRVSLTAARCCILPALPVCKRLAMGRSVKSVSRIYPNVNAQLGPSWHEYGQIGAC